MIIVCMQDGSVRSLSLRQCVEGIEKCPSMLHGVN